jgi:hypothetical protein
MSHCKLLSGILALMMSSFPAAAEPATESLADVAMALHEHFPRAVYSPFVCADTTCSKALNFPSEICGSAGCKDAINITERFNARIVVTMGADGRPVSIAAVVRSPRLRDPVQESFVATAFNACAVAVVALTAPDVTPDQRFDFTTKIIDADDVPSTHGGWTFVSRTTPLRFKIFEARRL